MTDAAHRVRLAAGSSSVDTRGDGRLQGGGDAHAAVPVAQHVGASLATEQTAFGQIAHDLQREERVAGSARGDGIGQAGHPVAASQQLGDQRRCLRIIQWGKHNRLRAVDMTQCAVVFGAVGDHDQGGVCGVTDRKSDNIDSLTPSIQCASSTT